MTKRVRVLLALSLGVLGVALLAPSVANRLATTVTIVAPASAEMVAANRELWVAGAPVAEIYGLPSRQPAHLLFIDRTKLLRPVEDPSLALYFVDKQRGDNPLQAKTVGFVAKFAAMGAAAVAGLLAVLGVWQHRRKRLVPTPVTAS